MAHTKIITLKSKLAPPRLKDTIPRPRLDALLDDIENHKAITVTAGAGFGKTICIGQACRNKGLHTVWYRLESSDGDAIVFVNYLIAGIRSYYPSFGEQTLANFQATDQFPSDSQEIWTPFLSELETTLRRPLVIVLDDFHLVDGYPEIVAGINFLMRHLPEQVHFIISSRTRTRLDFSRLIAARQVKDISEKDLTFNRTDIEHLYSHVFEIDLGAEALDLLDQKTGGWAAGLVLFHYALKDKEKLSEDIHTQVSLLNGNYRVFSDYLEENIFNLLPEEICAFLLRSSILSVLDVQFCDQLLGIENSGKILSRLEAMHLFTSALDEAGQSYQYHHLFREYLQAKLHKTYDETVVADLHLRAARILETQDDALKAIEHYLAAKAYEAAAVLIVTNGEKMIESGLVNQIISQCERFPESLMKSAPWLKLLLGAAMFTKGKTRESLEVIEKAHQQFVQREDTFAQERCMTLLGAIYCVLNEFSKAEGIFKSLMDQNGVTPDTYALSVGNLIFISYVLGKPDQVEYYFEQAAPLLKKTDHPLWHVWIYAAYGFSRFPREAYNDAIYFGETAEKHAKRLNKFSMVALSCHLIAMGWWELGDYEKGYEKAREGIDVSETFGFRGTTYAWCLIDAAVCAAGLKRYDDALDYGQKSLAIAEAADSDWTAAHAHATIGVIQMLNGRLENAETSGRRALKAIGRTSLDQDKASIQVTVAWIVLAKHSVDDALGLIREAERQNGENRKMKRWIRLFYCRLDVIAGRTGPAKDRLLQLLSNDPNDVKDRMILEQHRWIAPLLVALYAEGKCRERIEGLLARMRPEQLESVKASSRSASEKVRTAAKSLIKILDPPTQADLRIYSFGQFKLYKGDMEIEAQRWNSSKARLLFKYLAFYSRSGYIAKDRLLEMLWPEQDPEVTNKRLHVALSTIRKILEPDLARGARSAYLLRDNETYKLHLGDDGFSDVAAFDAAVDAAAKAKDPQQAIAELTEAESLYKGELLAEEPYTAWCAEARETYKEKYMAVLMKLADYYRDRHDFDKTIDYLQRYIAIDDCAEAVYYRLMTLYHAVGNRPMAIKTYEQCRRKLAEGLDVPPNDQTEQLYRRILAADDSRS